MSSRRGQREKSGPIGLVAKGIGKGIGLAQEYRARQAESKAQAEAETSSASQHQSSSSRDIAHADSKHQFDNLHSKEKFGDPHHQGESEDPPPEYHSDPEEEFDAEDWELDEAQHHLASKDSPQDFEALTGDDGADVDQVLQAYFKRYPTTPHLSELHPLPCPVILPQRRPKTNTRGFVHAYAPVLEGCGINQAAWIDFLNGFHKAIKMSPYFHAVNGAVGVTALTLTSVGFAMPIVSAAAIAMHISVEASRRGYTRYSTNKYLDQMNERLFKPRGLYCMIMSYKPDSDDAVEMIDVNSNTARAIAKRAGGQGHKFSVASGKTRGELQLPEAAPLIFPELDKLPTSGSTFKKGGAFLADYFDRKAQLEFERNNPNSRLNVTPHPEFHSKFLDPNHPMNDGSLVALVTGGKISGKRTRRAQRQGQIDPYTRAPIQRQRQSGQGPIGMVKRSLKENVLYLTVVNLPSDKELAQAAQQMKEAQLFDFS